MSKHASCRADHAEMYAVRGVALTKFQDVFAATHWCRNCKASRQKSQRREAALQFLERRKSLNSEDKSGRDLTPCPITSAIQEDSLLLNLPYAMESFRRRAAMPVIAAPSSATVDPPSGTCPGSAALLAEKENDV